nr:PlyM2 [uncultured phage]
MKIPVRQMLVNSKNHNIKCPFDMQAEYITIHNTYNDASANNEIQYMINNAHEVSFHFAVDDNEVVQGLPLNRNGWHCGDGGKGSGNRKSIGVEICYSKSGGTKYYKAEGLAIQFVAQLLHERGWGIDRVKKHQDWSKKHCPHRILDEGRWQSVLDAISKELDALKKPVKTSVVAAVENSPSVKIQTGGLNPEMVKEISDFFIQNKWYAEITFNFKKGNPTAVTGGLSGATRDKFESWLKERGWWYKVIK